MLSIRVKPAGPKWTLHPRQGHKRPRQRPEQARKSRCQSGSSPERLHNSDDVGRSSRNQSGQLFHEHRPSPPGATLPKSFRFLVWTLVARLEVGWTTL